MQMAREMRQSTVAERYLRKYHPDNFDPSENEERLEVKAVLPMVRAILADQASEKDLDLQPYVNYLNKDVLWELGHKVSPQCCNVNASGWRKLSTLALRSLVLAMGDRLLSLNLSGSTITKSALAYASVRFYSLANLNLSGCAELKDDSAAAIIAGCRATLTSLNVSHCPLLTHEALRWLAGIVGHPPAPCRKLQSLNASHCPLIRDEGLAALGKGTPLLDFVSFAHCDKITGKGMTALAAGCTRLRVVNVERCGGIDDAGLIPLGRYCHDLRSLNAARLSGLTNRTLRALGRGCPQLQTLNIAGAYAVTEKGLYHLAVGCPNLLVLNVNGCQKITDKGLGQLIRGRKFVERSHDFHGFVPKPDSTDIKFELQRELIAVRAATIIQVQFRGHKARRWFVIAMREYKERRASLLMTKYGRKWARRCKRARLVEEKRLGQYAVTMQCMYRCLLARRRIRAVQEHRHRGDSQLNNIARTQANWRRILDQRAHGEVPDQLAWMKLNRALEAETIVAMRFQAIARGRLSRTRFRATIEEQIRRRTDMHFAAVTIQSNYRGFAGRKYAAWYRVEMARILAIHNAAVANIQRVWEGFKGRKMAKWMKANYARILWERHQGAIRIQACARMFLAKLLLVRLREEHKLRVKTAIYLQKHWRRALQMDWRMIKLKVVQKYLTDRQTAARQRAKDSAHATWRKLQNELARDSCSEEEDDDDWQEVWDEEAGHTVFYSPSRNERRDKFIDEFMWERSLVERECAVKVYWPMEQSWFEGRMVRFNTQRRRFKIVYTDGDKEWMDVHTENGRVQVWEDGAWKMWRVAKPPNPAHEHQRERRLAAKKKAEEEKQAKEEAEAKAKADAKLVATFQAFLDDATGLPYWYNLRTGKTSWDDPTGGVVVPPEPTYALTAADTPWRRTWSEDYGCFYYYNATTMETTYEEPAEGFVDGVDDVGGGAGGGAGGSDGLKVVDAPTTKTAAGFEDEDNDSDASTVESALSDDKPQLV